VNKETDRVGINNPNPVYDLDVNGRLNIQSNTAFGISQTQIGQVASYGYIEHKGPRGSYMDFGTTTRDYDLRIGYYPSTAGYAELRTASDSSASTIAIMPKDGIGRVGINTQTPQFTLDVAGSAYISSGLILNPVSYGALKFQSLGDENGMFIKDGRQIGNSGVFIGNSTNYSSNVSTFAIGRIDGGIVQPGKAIYLTQAGNVGINNPYPQYALDVNGTTQITTSGHETLMMYRTANSANFGAGVLFHLNNSASTKILYGQMFGGIHTNTAGSEAGFIGFSLRYPGNPSLTATGYNQTLVLYSNRVGINMTQGTYPAHGFHAYVSTAVFVIQNPTDVAAVKFEFNGANLNFYKTAANATTIYNSGGNQLILGTTNPIIYMNGTASGNTNVGINKSSPQYALDVSGAIYASGDITAGSDMRFKTLINTIENPLSTLKNLRGVSYHLKNLSTSTRKIGVIAQEVEKVLPEVVSTDDSPDKFKSVAYGNITALLIESIKELSGELEILKTRIDNLVKK
jgi:hypothetical protein